MVIGRHVGRRIGTPARLELAGRRDGGGVDSCQPLSTLDRLEAFGLAAGTVGGRKRVTGTQ